MKINILIELQVFINAYIILEQEIKTFPLLTCIIFKNEI